MEISLPHARLLLVDDDPQLLDIFQKLLIREGYVVDVAMNLSAMKELLERVTYQAVLLDLRLGQESGLEGLPFVLKKQPFAAVVILTGTASIARAVECIKRGADAYLTKDQGGTEIVKRLGELLEARRMGEATTDPRASGDLIGSGLAMRELHARIERIRDVDSTVLVLGESGTGKEVVARALHRASSRAKGPFHAVNCSAIPEALLESELFGHRKGAFTDARNDRKGLFELSQNGTILLDEIGDMPAMLQAKLLRVLQERQVVPLGTGTPVDVNARVVAATHRDLREEVRAGRFREDLYFRLGVVVLQIPPLRDRRDDIPHLVRHFLERFNRRFERHIEIPSDAVMRRLCAYDWPGNVRELQNAVERGVVLAVENELRLEDMFDHLAPRFREREIAGATAEDELLEMPLSEAKQHFERKYLEHLLRRCGGNISEAARLSGRYRTDLYRLMERYGIDQETFR